ncbi:MAG TPA: hypothetical protein PKC35_20045, partial [Leptospiraceae bacterium]|nr:hypothetical protein [Leptospiraceae bacterium]
IVFAILGRAGDESAPQTLDELRMRLGIQFDAEAARKELHAPSDQILSDRPAQGSDSGSREARS